MMYMLHDCVQYMMCVSISHSAFVKNPLEKVKHTHVCAHDVQFCIMCAPLVANESRMCVWIQTLNICIYILDRHFPLCSFSFLLMSLCVYERRADTVSEVPLFMRSCICLIHVHAGIAGLSGPTMTGFFMCMNLCQHKSAQLSLMYTFTAFKHT